MRRFLTLTIFMMMATGSLAQKGKAQTFKKTFSRETTVCIHIQANAATVWKLLTDAQDFSRWNSTIISLEGEIKEGERIRLRSSLDEKRTFKLKVKEMVPGRKMVWASGQGQRVYTLEENKEGSLTFCMTEKIGGLMFPMYARYIPPFDESFETFAADLKREAEMMSRK